VSEILQSWRSDCLDGASAQTLATEGNRDTRRVTRNSCATACSLRNSPMSAGERLEKPLITCMAIRLSTRSRSEPSSPRSCEPNARRQNRTAGTSFALIGRSRCATVKKPAAGSRWCQ